MENSTIIVIVILVAVIGSLITYATMPWYKSHVVVSGTPPDYVFGIVWTVIYIGYAYAWIKTPGYDTLFTISIILNLLWTVFFFGLADIRSSQICIIALLLVVLYQFHIIYKEQGFSISAFAMTVYATWLVIATSFNFNAKIV